MSTAPPRGNRLIASFFYTHPDILIKVVWDSPNNPIPDMRVRVKRTDMVYVVKVKLERALANISPHNAVSADELELEHRGQVLKETKALDLYSVTEGSEVVATFCTIPSEQDLVDVQPDHDYLDQLIVTKPGVQSSGMVKQIVSQHGHSCQCCWRRRWFRCQILRIYPTSMLVAWHDWPESEWPHFFLKLNLPSAAGAPALPGDETWRVRWHKTKALAELPVVEPLFAQLPPILWLRAVVRVYALADEKQMLQEIHDHLPPDEAAAMLKTKRLCIVVLGDSGTGKTTLVNTLCKGAPEVDAFADEADEAGQGGGEESRKEWPTVAPRCFHTSVKMPGGLPGEPPVDLEVWDTSGRERFKALSLAFYKRADACLLVFDVKDRRSFESLGRVGGWRDEFARMTGASPQSFPFVLVGNKCEHDLTADRRVFEEDVRDWCHGEGGVMPYVETSFVGNAADSHKAAQRVFRNVVRANLRSYENFGRYRPPDTVRVPAEEEEEDDIVDQAFKSLGKSMRRMSNEVAEFFKNGGGKSSTALIPAPPPPAVEEGGEDSGSAREGGGGAAAPAPSRMLGRRASGTHAKAMSDFVNQGKAGAPGAAKPKGGGGAGGGGLLSGWADEVGGVFQKLKK